MASTDVRTLVSLQELPRCSSLPEVFLIFSIFIGFEDSQMFMSAVNWVQPLLNVGLRYHEVRSIGSETSGLQ